MCQEHVLQMRLNGWYITLSRSSLLAFIYHPMCSISPLACVISRPVCLGVLGGWRGRSSFQRVSLPRRVTGKYESDCN